MTNNPINNIQICRAVAAVMVVLTHVTRMVDKSYWDGFFMVGHVGVDLFFVISGFIIYYVSYAQIGRPDQLAIFAKKRFVRIFPIYWVYTIPFLILSLVKLSTVGRPLVNWAGHDLISIIKSLTLYPTHVEQGDMPILPVAWTLSYEVMFYIIFGLSIVFGFRYLIAAFAVWIACLVIFNVVLPDNYGPLLNTAVHFRNLAFLLGVLAGHLKIKNKTIQSSNLATLLFIGSLIFISYAWFLEMTDQPVFERSYGTAFGIPFAVMLYALISMKDVSSKNMLTQILIVLGNASYSIYLTHYVVVALTKNVLDKYLQNNALEFWIAFAESMVVGCLCYQYIEKPVLAAAASRFGLKSRVRPEVAHSAAT